MPPGPGASPCPADLVPLGRVVAGHGVRGLARVKPFNPTTSALRGLREAWLRNERSGETRRVEISECRPHKRVLLLHFEGIERLEDLEPWIGSTVEIESDLLAPADEGQIYHHEAIGLAVRTVAGDAVGNVVEVLSMPANDVWVVRSAAASSGEDDGKGPREHLVPAVSPILVRIDLRERVALIDPPAGLLED